MRKETFYFPHDYNARNDLKIQALMDDYGGIAYAAYFIIVEILHEEPTHTLEINPITFKALARQVSTSVEQIENVFNSCLTYGLFVEDNGMFYSDRVNDNIDIRSELSEKRSKAGRISAEVRAKARKEREKATHVEQVLTGVQHNPTKERKGKESKVKEINKDVFDFKKDFLAKYANAKDILLKYETWIDYMEKQHKVILQENIYTYQTLERTIKRIGPDKIIEAIDQSIDGTYKKIFYNEPTKGITKPKGGTKPAEKDDFSTTWAKTS